MIEVRILNVSPKAQQILQERGITELEEVAKRTPASLKRMGLSLDDLFSLRAQLSGHFGRKWIIRRRERWSKPALRRLYQGDKREPGTEIIPPGVKADEGVIQRAIHRASTGKHYRKPRRKGLF